MKDTTREKIGQKETEKVGVHVIGVSPGGGGWEGRGRGRDEMLGVK